MKKKIKQPYIQANAHQHPECDITPITKPVPFKWKKKLTASLIKNAINEGRE